MATNTGLSIETVYQLWIDKTGERIEVGPDSDGLEMVEIRFVDADKRVCSSLAISLDQARCLPDLIQRVVADLSKEAP